MKTILHFFFLFAIIVCMLPSCASKRKSFRKNDHSHFDLRYENSIGYHVAKADMKTIHINAMTTPGEKHSESSDVRKVIQTHKPGFYTSVKKSKMPHNNLMQEVKPGFKTKLKQLSMIQKIKNADNGNGGNSGLLTVIMGLVLIGLGYLFFSFLGAVFGQILFLIFGIGGCIMLLAGLIKMIVG